MPRLRALLTRLAPISLFIASGFALSAASARAADWNNMGGDAGRDALTSEQGPTTANLAWSGGRNTLIAWHPVTEGNRVFMVRQTKWPYQQPDDAYIVAQDLSTGAELWARVLPYNNGDWIPWIAGVRDGHVYCSRSGNGASVSAAMYALNVADGSTAWISQDVQTCGAYDGVVFAPDGDLLVASFADIWRIDSETGHTVWHTTRVGSVSGSCGGARFGSGLYILDAVYGGHVLKKIDVETGQLLYSSPLMPGFLCQNMPFVGPDGSVLINRAENSENNDYLYSWRDTGSAFVLKWQVHGFDGANSQQAVGPDNSVYSVTSGSLLARLNGETGAVMNSIPLPAGFSMARMACDAAGRLYFSNGAIGAGHLYVYTADLEPVWDTTVSGINIGGPSIGQNGMLVVCNTGTDVRAYRPEQSSVGPAAVAESALLCAPNPFRERTAIHFTLARGGPVHLTLHDAQGRLVRTFMSAETAAGLHQVEWNGRDETGTPVPAGVYLYRLATRDGVATGRLVCIR